MSYEPPSHFFKVAFYTLDGITTSEVEGRSFTVGRSSRCDLQIESQSVSRKHLKISIENAVILVQDCGSSAGTRIGDKKLEPNVPVKYRQGDLIQIGKSEIYVTVNSGTVANVILNEPDLSEKVVDVMHSSQVTRKLKGWLEDKVGKDGFNLGASLRHRFLKTIEELAQKEENIEYQAEDIIKAASNIGEKIKAKAHHDGKNILEACHNIADEVQLLARQDAESQARHIIDDAQARADEMDSQLEAEKDSRMQTVHDEVEAQREKKMAGLDKEVADIRAKAKSDGEAEKEQIIDQGNRERRKRLSEIDKMNKEAEDRRRKMLDEAGQQAESLRKKSSEEAQAKAKEVVAEGQSTSEQLIRTAKDEAEQIKSEAENRVNELKEQISKFENDREWAESQFNEWNERKSNLQGEVEKVLNAADEEIEKARVATQAEINRAMELANEKANMLVTNAKEKAADITADGESKATAAIEEAKKKAEELAVKVEQEANAEKARVLSHAEKEKSKLLKETNKECELLLKDAKVESDELIKGARAEAKAQIADAKVESVKIEQEIQKLQAEQRQLEELMDQLEEKAGGEEERLERLRQQQQEFAEVEANLKKGHSELQVVSGELSNKQGELSEIQSDLNSKTQALEQAETQTAQLRSEFEELTQRLKEDEERHNVEARFAAEKFQTEQKQQRKELAQELAEEKLKRMREIEQEAADAEKRFHSHMGDKIQRISSDIELQLFSFFKRAGLPLEEQKGADSIGKEILGIVDNVLGKGEAKQRENLQAIVDYNPEDQVKLKNFWIKSVAGVAAIIVAISLLAYLEKDLSQLMDGMATKMKEGDSASDIYMKNKIEEQREEARFNPEQSPDYKDSYTDNVLYTTNYLAFEGVSFDGSRNVATSNLKDKWILDVNSYFVEDLELPESIVVKVLGKEAGLLKILSEIRRKIDARTSELRIGEMRAAEESFNSDLREILGSQDSIDKFRDFKRKFYERNCDCL